MKLFKQFNKLLMFAFMCNIAFSYGFSQSIETTTLSLDEQNVTIKDVFNKISNITDFNITYGNAIANKSQRFDVVYGNAKLSLILNELASKVGFNYLVKGNNVLIRPLDAKTGTTQQATIQGIVRDDTGMVLPGASVVEKGTSNGTTTDFDGNFSINVSGPDAILVVSYIGYKTQEVPLAGIGSRIEVTLLLDTSRLDEVVVTALGIERDKSELGYSTQQVAIEDVNLSRNGNVLTQLQGRVPGLSITSSAGGVISSSRVVLRGEASLNLDKNQPLFIVDGVPISNNLDRANISNGFSNFTDPSVDFGNGALDLNPDDIESINVLKGPNAAALYGSRATNGAIIITTRSGRNQKGMGIEVNTGVTMEEIAVFWETQDEYGGGRGGNYTSNSGVNWGPALNGQDIAQDGSPDFPNASPFIHRMNLEDFFQTGVTFNNNIAVTSGLEKGHFRFSYTDLRRTGIVPNTDFRKNNFSFNSGYNVTDKLKVDLVANYVERGSDNQIVNGYTPQGLMYPLIWTYRNTSLDWFRDYWAPGQEDIAQSYIFSWTDNPFLVVNENINAFDSNRIFGNVKASYILTENLKFQFRAGIDRYDERRMSRRPIGTVGYRNGMYREQSIGFSESNIDFLFTYYKDLTRNLSLNATLGGNRLTITSNDFLLEGRALGIPGVYNAGNISETPLVSQIDTKKRINSLYGSIQFGFKNSVYLDITGRNDWSSTLPTDNNSYFYPSAGFSAILSEMFTLPEFISFGKIRAGLAQVGGDTDPFLTQQTYVFGRLPGSVQNSELIANQDLLPEETNSFEIGTELGFLQNRITLEFNYYNNVSKNQILRAPVSSATGFEEQLINAGRITNKGIELLLTTTPIKTSNLQWDLSVNFARNRGEVDELTEGVENFIIGFGGTEGTLEARPGERFGDIYGLGFQRSPEGGIIYENGLPLTTSEVIRVGNAFPDWTAGLVSTFSYKGFTLGALIDYRKGGRVFSFTNAILIRAGTDPITLEGRETGIVGEGVVDNGDGTFSPNTTNVSAEEWFRSYYVRNNVEANSFDATYWKIKEVSLGYDMSKLFANTPIKNARIALVGRDLFVKAKEIRHFDPERALTQNGGTLVPGFERTQFPGTRTYALNLSFKF